MSRLQADALLVLAALIWGLAFVFQKTAMEHIGPVMFVTLRSVVAVLALIPLVWWETKRARARAAPALTRHDWGLALLAGAIFALAAMLQQAGMIEASVTNAGFLTALYVIATPLLAWMLFAKAPGVHIWMGVGLAFAGVWLLGGGQWPAWLGGAASGEASARFHLSTGDWLIAASALAWAGHLIVTGIAMRAGRPMTFTCVQFGVVAVLAMPFALWLQPASLDQIAQAGVSLLYVGVLSSAVGFVLMAAAMKHTSASETAILASLETVFAALAGALLLAERLPALGYLGAGAILLAVLVVQLGRSPGQEDDKTAAQTSDPGPADPSKQG